MTGYYDDWEKKEYTCLHCSWIGLGEQLIQGDVFKDLFEQNCPNCAGRISVMMHPSVAESRTHWDKVSPADKLVIEHIEKRTDVFNAVKLARADQLPDIVGEDLIFIWDISKYDGGDTIIRYGNCVIWQEPAFYEGYERFIEVLKILNKKYGKRLQDLVPTRKSRLFLFGDCLSAKHEVELCRKQFQ